MIPNKVTVELEDKDIQEDLSKVVDAMAKIRAETLANQTCNDKQKDEYLHLTYRLASGIEALADRDLTKRIEETIAFIDQDERLLHYDHFQDQYWRKHHPDFSRTLDKIVISGLRDDFHSLQSKHHFLQAMKFLGVADSPFEEKDKIYSTILPSHGKVRSFRKRGKISTMIGKLLGISFKIEQDTEQTLRIRGNPAFLEDILEEARDMGYQTVQIDMFQRDFDQLHSKIPHMQEKMEGLEKPTLFNIPYNQKKIRRMIQNAIRFTTPLSYPLLGFLPASLQERIKKYTERRAREVTNFGNFNPKKAVIASNFVEGIGGLALAAGCGIALGIRASHGLTYFEFIPLGVVGLYGVVEGIVRGVLVSHDDPRSEHVSEITGSAPCKLIMYPLEKILNARDKRGDFCRVEVKLYGQTTAKEAEDESLENMFSYFTQVAQIPVPGEEESNLVWSQQNHNQYAKYFAAYLDGKRKELKAQPALETRVDRKNQKYNLFHILKIGEYRKCTTLACSQGERYVVSGITSQNSTDFVGNVNEVLASTPSTIEKAKEITRKLQTEFTHLAHYRGGNLVDDYEIIS